MIFTFLLLLLAAGITGAAWGIGVYLAFIVAYYVLYAVGAYNMFKKAGVAGWKAFVPLLNEYEVYKLAWAPGAFWVYLIFSFVDAGISKNNEGNNNFFVGCIGFVAFAMECLLANKLAKAFGKGVLFTLGLLLLQPIFIMILGLGDSKYLGPQA